MAVASSPKKSGIPSQAPAPLDGLSKMNPGLFPGSPQRKTSLLAGLLVAGTLLVGGGIFFASNMHNEFVPAGYAGYVQKRPLFGKATFEGIRIGASSTGWVWRTYVQLVSVTPYSKIENIRAIQASDNLLVDTEASITFCVDRDPKAVRQFFEQYGGWDERKVDPDRLVEDSYAQFVRPQFCMFIRDAVSRYEALDVKSHFPDIKRQVMDNMNEYFSDTPFKLNGIAIQSTTPPAEVSMQITAKVAESQKFEKKRIELQTAQAEIEVQEAMGRAEARRQEQLALGALAKAKAESEAVRYRHEQEAAGLLAQAKARKALNDATGDNLIRYELTRQLPEIKWPHIYVGEGILQQLQDMVTPGINKLLPLRPDRSVAPGASPASVSAPAPDPGA